jgi:hypothetical membrane protein
MGDSETVLRAAGLAAVVVAFGGTLLATFLSPSFAWTGNALSDLGVTWTAAGTGLTALVFNGSLVAGGAVGLGFAVALARAATHLRRLVVAGLFGLTVTAMGLIGLFPLDSPLHFSVATGFYLLISVLLWTDGVVALRERKRGRGVVALGLGTTNLSAWIVWGATGPVSRPGLAMPELVGAVAFSAWVVWISRSLLEGGESTNH